MSDMLNNLTRLAAVVLFAALLAVPAVAQPRTEAGVRQLLQSRDQEIKTLLGTKSTFTAEQRAQLMDLINGIIDFEAMGRQALGPHWNDLTAQQRADFVRVFGEIVRVQSLSDLDMYRTPVTYGTIAVDGTTARATTNVTYKDVPATVVYVLSYRGDQWRVDDVILDDVSTAEGYARSFQAVVRKHGFDRLMQSLEKRLARTRQ